MLSFVVALAAAADPLVEKLVARAGNPYAEPGLVFTFVVGDTRRTHRWDVAGGKVEVTWTDKEARRCAVVTTTPYAGEDTLQQQAWAMFVNDQYWLLAPAKLLDPGVITEVQGADVHVRFEKVGLTPGDRYVFHVEPSTGDVNGWDYTLEGGRTGAWTWAPPTAVGGLRLSLLRTSADRVIQFEDVRSERVTLGAPGGGCTAP